MGNVDGKSFLGQVEEFVEDCSLAHQGVKFGLLCFIVEGSLGVQGQGGRGGSVVRVVLQDGVEVEDDGSACFLQAHSLDTVGVVGASVGVRPNRGFCPC